MLIEPEIEEKIADVSFLDAGGVEHIKYPYYLLKELKIPFVMVVDRDFFFPYINSKLEDSRNSRTGLPIYSDILKDDVVINDLFSTVQEKELLRTRHNEGYRKFFEYINNYGILSMNYCLEMDLSCSEKAREMYYDMGNIMPANRNQKFLLEKHGSSIKKIDKILKILEALPKKSYPESYIKIKNAIIEDINNNIL